MESPTCACTRVGLFLFLFHADEFPDSSLSDITVVIDEEEKQATSGRRILFITAKETRNSRNF